MAKTLLQMAGADLTPPKLAETVLVVVDAQREYVDGALKLPGAPAALERIARLLDQARAAGAPVIHVQHKGKAGSLFDPATPAFELAPEAAARDGEAIIEKGLPNAFAGTNLKEALDATGRKRLLLAGFMTHMCISSTARAALDLGFQTTIVSDASATRDLPVPGTEGEVLTADDLHRAELAMLADRFAIICTTNELAG